MKELRKKVILPSSMQSACGCQTTVRIMANILSAYSGPGSVKYLESIITLNSNNRSMPLLLDTASVLQQRKLRLRDVREVEYGLTAMN